jgi:spore maturation protein CgeB
MKILLVGPKWIGGWLEGVEQGIRALGHDVRVFVFDTPYSPNAIHNKMIINSYAPSIVNELLQPFGHSIGDAWESVMNQRLIKTSRAYRADLVFILKGELLQAETLEALKRSARHVVSWWVDNPVFYFQNYPQVASQLQLVDLLFVFDHECFDELQSLGISNLVHLSCACDPTVYYPRRISAKDQRRFQCDIGLIANFYPERGELLQHMQGINVAIWGSGWKNLPELESFPPNTLRAKKLAGSDVAKVYNIARICPNVHHFQSRAGGLNMRAYEIPAAGGFELADYIPGMEDQFELGKEMIVYRSPEHFRDLAEYYLAHDDEQRMKKAFEAIRSIL